MDQIDRSIAPERYAEGYTFPDWLDYLGSAENLARAGNAGDRRDWSDWLRARYEATRLTEAQGDALRMLADRADGPRKILVIAEEWSSDCRRDLPYVARMAEAADFELRIFSRDGEGYGTAQVPDPEQSPNADLMSKFLLERNSETWQAIPVVAFYSDGLGYLTHYLEYPVCYSKDRLAEHRLIARADESPQQANIRSNEEFAAMLATPMYDVWATAAVSEMIAALFERFTITKTEA
jgi:hypothetical protein